jgi:predicted CXXCH cytochrome family protein
MRFKTIFLAGSILLGLSNLSFGQGTIVGSKHDFSQTVNAWNFTTPVASAYQGQICLPCHTPHTANITTAGANAPLWSHTLSSQTYTLYSGYKFSATGHGAATQTQPDGSSKLCLACHDGTVALAGFTVGGGTYYAPVGGATMATFNGGSGTGFANLGTDLSTTHPISFVYDATLASNDRHLYNPNSTMSGIHGNNISTDMLETAADGTTKLQCISCHDPHNAAGANHLLIKSNAGSALCYTCHKI